MTSRGGGYRAGRLSPQAREEIQAFGFSLFTYVRTQFPGEATWRGDVCGCPDDRCIGYHHGPDDECRCLPAVLEGMAAQVLPAIGPDESAGVSVGVNVS